MQKDKETLRARQKDLESGTNHHTSEIEKINNKVLFTTFPSKYPIQALKDTERESQEKKDRLDNEVTIYIFVAAHFQLENVEKEAAAAEDKLATTLHNLQANEKQLAMNFVKSMKSLRSYFRSVTQHLDLEVAAMEEAVRGSRRSRVFGEELEVHLR